MVDATFPFLFCGSFAFNGFIIMTGQGSNLIPLILVLSLLQRYNKEVHVLHHMCTSQFGGWEVCVETNESEG